MSRRCCVCLLFFFTAPATPEIYTLSLTTLFRSKFLNVLCDIDGRLIAGAPGGDLGVGPQVDATAEERAGGEHDGVRAEAAPVGCHDTRGARAVREQTRDHSLREVQLPKPFEQ